MMINHDWLSSLQIGLRASAYSMPTQRTETNQFHLGAEICRIEEPSIFKLVKKNEQNENLLNRRSPWKETNENKTKTGRQDNSFRAGDGHPDSCRVCANRKKPTKLRMETGERSAQTRQTITNSVQDQLCALWPPAVNRFLLHFMVSRGAQTSAFTTIIAH